MKIPTYIAAAKIVGAPIKYKWNNDLAMDFYDGTENVRLYDAIDASSFKAKMALGIALTEWIVWRFESHADLSDAHRRIEAAWASVINPLYAKNLELEMSADDDKEVVKGALELALCLLGEANADYTKGSIYLAETVMKQTQLARHLIPNKKEFENWLSDTLRRTAKVFPRGVDYDEDTEIYDASHEKAVPRDFFDPAFRYTEGSAEKALSDFLKTLDPNQNPYLCSAAEMKRHGFKGTPYRL
jgi:hypothetical protein